MLDCKNCLHYEVCQALEEYNGLAKCGPDCCGCYKDESSIINNKEIPMKLTHTISRKKCARCGHIITDKNCVKHKIKYCYTCGQKIDWEEEK